MVLKKETLIALAVAFLVTIKVLLFVLAFTSGTKPDLVFVRDVPQHALINQAQNGVAEPAEINHPQINNLNANFRPYDPDAQNPAPQRDVIRPINAQIVVSASEVCPICLEPFNADQQIICFHPNKDTFQRMHGIDLECCIGLVRAKYQYRRYEFQRGINLFISCPFCREKGSLSEFIHTFRNHLQDI